MRKLFIFTHPARLASAPKCFKICVKKASFTEKNEKKDTHMGFPASSTFFKFGYIAPSLRDRQQHGSV